MGYILEFLKLRASILFDDLTGRTERRRRRARVRDALDRQARDVKDQPSKETEGELIVVPDDHWTNEDR